MVKEKTTMPEKSLTGQWVSLGIAILALLPAPLIARMLYHQRLVRLGKRRMWSWELAWEIPTAALCAVLAGGLAQYLELPLLATHAMAGVVGWLGPRGLEVVAARHFKIEPTETQNSADSDDPEKTAEAQK